MKNKLKKGFTIVELVIVIAVIAILAAVLIPTFSSITNSARESAALQEAKSGSETILALTTGTLPENSAFIVADDEESDTNDYTFVFAGQKIQNVNAVEEFSDVLNMCKRNDVMKSGAATEGYIVYVSIDALKLDDNGQVTDTVAGGADGEAEQATLDTHVANRILAALNIPADGATYTYDLAQNGNYAMWTSSDIVFNIYWTSDFNPTLIAFMGGNVADDEPEVETVNVTCDGATVDKTTVEKGTAANLVLTLTAAEEYAAYYTVTVGEFTTDVQQVGGKLSVTIPSQYTGSDFNITVKVATVTVTISGGNVNGKTTVEVAKGEETTLEITPGETGTTYGVTVSSGEESGEEDDIAPNGEGKLSVTLTADQTQNNITVSIMKK
ncbi:MAG TPA: type II secretion system GspH family protein [Firmicutes bacterium]|nr:type II secretion system GspH family protein [Bacillota bacterium]